MEKFEVRRYRQAATLCQSEFSGEENFARLLPTEYHLSISKILPVEMTRVDPLLLRDLAKTRRASFER